MEQWLVRIVYGPSSLEESEECVCASKAEAVEMAAALAADYPDAQVDIVDAVNGRPDRWAVSVWFEEENESCNFATLAEAREYADSLAADYADGALDVIAKEITISDSRGRVEFVLARNMPIAV